MNGGAVAGISIACFLVGLIGGFFVFRFITKRELKKNPPINKDQVRALLRATGRTPSEARKSYESYERCQISKL